MSGASSPLGMSAEFQDYEAARRAMEAAYARLKPADRLRAERGTIIGMAMAGLLGVLWQTLQLGGVFSLFAQALVAPAWAASQGAGRTLPDPLAMMIYATLLVVFFIASLLVMFRDNPDQVVRDIWKTLSGFFIGVLLK